jgi:hypothetical protein
MVRVVLIAVTAVLAGCYTPQLSDCATTCGASQLCPDGLSCVAGYCRTEGASGTCSTTNQPDAPVQPIDAPLADMAMACPPVPMQQGCTLVGAMPVMPYCFAACAAKTGTQAQAFAVGSWHIARIDSAAEQTAAMTASNNVLSWIGLSQPQNQATPAAGWTWIGAGPPVFAAWAPNQPEDGNGVEDNQQNCGALGGGGWGDEPCTDMRVFLIEPF